MVFSPSPDGDQAGHDGHTVCHQDPLPAHTSRKFSLASSPVDHWASRKSFCAPEMGFVTVFIPLMTTGPGETVVQATGATRFPVHCKVNPVALAGHVRMTFVPEGVIVSSGGLGDAREMLNTVPFLNPP